MKIGDMVVRAYAFHAFIPGIIIDDRPISHHGDEETWCISDEEYAEHNFIVAWSDGNTSREMDIELYYLDEAMLAMQECDVIYPERR